MWSSDSSSTFWLEVTPHTIDDFPYLFSHYSDLFKHQADAESFAAQLAGAQWPRASLPHKVLGRYCVLVTQSARRLLARSRRHLNYVIRHVQRTLAPCKATEIGTAAEPSYEAPTPAKLNELST
jgi:hypothetical protein